MDKDKDSANIDDAEVPPVVVADDANIKDDKADLEVTPDEISDPTPPQITDSEDKAPVPISESEPEVLLVTTTTTPSSPSHVVTGIKEKDNPNECEKQDNQDALDSLVNKNDGDDDKPASPLGTVQQVVPTNATGDKSLVEQDLGTKDPPKDEEMKPPPAPIVETAPNEQVGGGVMELDPNLEPVDDEPDPEPDSELLAQVRSLECQLREERREFSRREKVLIMKLTSAERQVLEYEGQVRELKKCIVPTTAQLRDTLLDPAVNLIIQKLRKELEETKKKLEDTQNDLSAWKFTPDSNVGKRLMAKCRMLHLENEDLGRQVSSGRIAKLENDLALQKSLVAEMKQSQSELDEMVQELDEDVEGLQTALHDLQQSTTNTTSSSGPSPEKISKLST